MSTSSTAVISQSQQQMATSCQHQRDDNDIALINEADSMISIAVVPNNEIDNGLSIRPEFICSLTIQIPQDSVLLVRKGDTSTQNETVYEQT